MIHIGLLFFPKETNNENIIKNVTLIHIISFGSLMPIALSPALIPLLTVIITILSICGYIPYTATITCTLVGMYIGYYTRLVSTMTCIISIILACIAGTQTYNQIEKLHQHRANANISHNGDGFVYDIDPITPYTNRRMAHIVVTPHSDIDPYYCKVRISNKSYLWPGDYIYMRNVKIPPITNTSFSWHLIRENCAGYMFKTPYIRKIHRPSWSLRRSIHKNQQQILSLLYRNLRKENADVVSHIFLGCKNTPSDTKFHFEKWGISHLLARSGLHLMIFTACCAWLIRWIPVYYLWQDIIILLLVILYAGISWPTVSFNRALYMIFGYYICRAFQTRYHAHHWIVITAIITLCYNPIHLLFLDFQLSFALTFTLCWLFTISCVAHHKSN